MSQDRAARNPLLPPLAELHAAVRARDSRYEGVFVFGVQTTGVYCRPGCPARTPRPEHVAFYANGEAAAADGLRPCRRCQPERAAGAAPPWMQELESELACKVSERLTDDDLAARGLESKTVRRAFLARYGMTFHAWQRAQGLARARERLKGGESVLAAGMDGGYASTSGFRSAFSQLFGAPPSRGRAASVCRARLLPSPLGALIAVASERGVCLLEFADHAHLERQTRALARRRASALVPGSNRHLDQLAEELGEYFAGRRLAFEVELDVAGAPFQLAVWEALRAIPAGETRSYAELAAALGRTGAQRAVARANASNHLAIVIPCHRVIGSDGRLVGYGGGLWRKRRLLELEAAAASGAVQRRSLPELSLARASS
jgi:AraC family transcriptional regulator, regulatory protein of adaptative response / methylated-DNA-[protein]-cysteine methyltransferase